MIQTSQRILSLIAFLFLISSCKDTAPDPLASRLSSSELVNTYTRDEFKTFLESSAGGSAAQVSLFVQYGIEQYKLTYKTIDIDGTEITASGVVVLPAGISTPLAMASLQHGTLFNESDAPSYLKANSEATIGSFFASTGMAIAIPDYIGYGASKDRLHPYEHREGLAIPVVDFIKATKEFLDQKNIEWNKKLLLAGYSEGGYATMAAYQYLEQNLKSTFPVTVCIPGAGAYNKSESFRRLINETGSTNSGNNRSYIWVLQTYLRANNINQPWSYFFKEPYASQIEEKGYLAEINVSLNETLQPDFVDAFNKGELPELEAAISENDVFDWKPSSKLRMYHGDADDYVPYFNSQTTLEAMKANGAPDVELITVKGGTHGSTISTYFTGVLELFISNK